MGEEIDTSALSALDCFLSGVYARVMELDLCLPDTGRGANFSLGLPAVFWSVVLLPPLIEETLVFPPLDELSALSLAAVEKLLAGELDAAGPGPPSGLSSIPPLEIGELPGFAMAGLGGISNDCRRCGLLPASPAHLREAIVSYRWDLTSVRETRETPNLNDETTCLIPVSAHVICWSTINL